MRNRVYKRAVAALLLAGVGACSPNPVSGRKQLLLVPEQQIVQAASESYLSQINQAKQQGKLDLGSATVRRVRRIAQRIVTQAQVYRPESRQWAWEIHVLNDPNVNAYCMAGGKIAVFTGLLQQIKPSDDELAQVIAHEVAHALSSHSREKISLQLGADLALQLLASARNSSPQEQQILNTATTLAVKLPNSRTMENEADRIGIELAARAGFNPQAAISLWQKMQQASAGAPPEFLSTHPSEQTRVARLQALLPQMILLYTAATRQ